MCERADGIRPAEEREMRRDDEKRNSRATSPDQALTPAECFDAGYRQGTADTLDLIAEQVRAVIDAHRLRVTDSLYDIAVEQIARVGAGYTQSDTAFRLGAGFAFETVVDAIDGMRRNG